ncbi:MAG: metal-dependent hydrolase [Chitinispirillaceae bacterium]|nr:metal-dependent hydrolase [Chitinispirillaceae bacterium]
MLIAHAPAGYLLTRLLSRTLFKDIVLPQRTNRFYQILMCAGILGGIFPDFDFIYHIFIDSDHTSHHSYLTHLPMFWLSVWLILFAIGRMRKDRRFVAVATTFCASVMLHLVFDTITGKIYWLYPFVRTGVNVFKVADVHIWWVHNYTHHWTFLIEIVIIAAAMIIFLRVKETIGVIAEPLRRNRKLRLVSLRLTVCALGVSVVMIVGSMRFSIDNRIVHKVKQLKQYIVRMAFSS